LSTVAASPYDYAWHRLSPDGHLLVLLKGRICGQHRWLCAFGYGGKGAAAAGIAGAVGAPGAAHAHSRTTDPPHVEVVVQED
ncbi:hypothetical protein V490_04092, partial [Pseudogymnoascus sp. VKM F-3557]